MFQRFVNLKMRVCGVIRPRVLRVLIAVLGPDLPSGVYAWAGACRVTVVRK